MDKKVINCSYDNTISSGFQITQIIGNIIISIIIISIIATISFSGVIDSNENSVFIFSLFAALVSLQPFNAFMKFLIRKDKYYMYKLSLLEDEFEFI